MITLQDVYIVANTISLIRNFKQLPEYSFYFMIGVDSVIIEPCPIYDKIINLCNRS